MIVLTFAIEWLGAVDKYISYHDSEEEAFEELFEYSIHSLVYFSIENHVGKVIAKYKRNGY